MLLLPVVALLSPAPCQDFVNWETPQVHPMDLAADGTLLLVAHTADNRMLAFDVEGDEPLAAFDVPVGLDPVSVRFRTPGEAWVVNHVSDTVSVVDLQTQRVRATLQTADEPCDVVFAGNPQRAYVSCSQANLVQVFDPAQLELQPLDISIAGEDPRALAVAPDGSAVYVAVFESGNGTTLLGGGLNVGGPDSYPPNAVSDPGGPWGGLNPAPNAGTGFSPPLAPGLPAPPDVGLIVKRDSQGNWFDDNGGDWTRYVTGDRAELSGRKEGWDLTDHDLAVIDTSTLSVDYVDGLMNICMGLAVRPSDGRVTVVGTEATNHVRFEPNLAGSFARVHGAQIDPSGATPAVIHDLNPHLDYTVASVPPSLRVESVGDPRAVVWSADGSTAWVAGMGSNNVVRLAPDGTRSGSPIRVGEGPSGLALDSAGQRLFVLQRFAASVGVVDLASNSLAASVPFFDPTPDAIREGRRFLYDTHETSGTGHTSCATCHVDARMDRLAWNLGDPTGDMKAFEGNCRDNGCEDWHPMKGPLVTQTLQDIIGQEPHHWRGDKAGIEAFNSTFTTLMGADAELTPKQMQALEDYLASIAFPPNPFRLVDNTLPSDLPLDGHYRTGRFGNEGQPLPNGNALRGLELFRPPNFLDGGASCVSCHTLPTGMGTGDRLQGGVFLPIAPGPNGEAMRAITSGDGVPQKSIKIPHLRNMHERVGHDATQLESRAGFGFMHDGAVDSLARFVAEPAFLVQDDQDVADLVAFMLAFAGSDLPPGSDTDPQNPPGGLSLDTHAGVGAQVTLADGLMSAPGLLAQIDQFEALADRWAVDLVVKGHVAGQARGYWFSGGVYQSDRLTEQVAVLALRAQALAGSELTWTLVPVGTGRRIGIDRDRDGSLDRDELDGGSDPADPLDRPLGIRYCSPAVPNSSGLPGELFLTGSDQLVDDSFRLGARNLPLDEFGYFLVSPAQDFVLNAGGSNGHLCLGGDIGRFNQQALSTTTLGQFTLQVDLGMVPEPDGFFAIQPGETWYFQAWYRDQPGENNLTDAVGVQFF